jgi:predicted PurR-regulated permease PerM
MSGTREGERPMNQDDREPVPPEGSSFDLPAAADELTGAAEPSTATVGEVRQRFYELGGPTRLLLPLALTAIIVYGMKYAGSILNPIFLALFLTMGASPALSWMRRKGVAPWLSVAIVLVVMVFVVLLFLGVVVGMLGQLDDKLPVYQENIDEMYASIHAWFADRGIDISGLTQGSLSPANIMGAVKNLISTGINMMTSVVLMILIILFMVAETYAIPERINKGIKMSPRFRQSLSNFSDSTRTYLFTKAWLGAIVAVFVTAVYYLFGTDFALVWGILFFVLSFIPNIGFVLSIIPPFFITLLEFGFARAALVTIIVIIVNAIVDNVLSPKIMGRSVGLSSLTVFLSLMFWGWVFGGMGGLLCVPLTLMVKLLLFDSFDSTQGISQIMETPVRDLGKGKKNKGKGGWFRPRQA